MRACLPSNVDSASEWIRQNYVIVRLNYALLEFFLPSVFNRIGEANKAFAKMRDSNEDEILSGKLFYIF